MLGAGFAAWCFAAWTCGGATGAWLARTPLPWMGRVSYSTYLWHLPVLSAVLRASTRRGAPADPWTLDVWLGSAGLLALIYLLSWVSYRCFEEPWVRRAAAADRR
jgi:peptidoglycan/LPS O-acetylase OafA/YrhL